MGLFLAGTICGLAIAVLIVMIYVIYKDDKKEGDK